MPVAGGSPKQLTFLDSFNVGGVWSADGKQIAFVSTQGGRLRVWTVGADGGTPRPVSSGDLSSSFDVAWSPGSRILIGEPETEISIRSIRKPATNGSSHRTVRSDGCPGPRIRATDRRLPCSGIAARAEVSGSSIPKSGRKDSCTRALPRPTSSLLDGLAMEVRFTRLKRNRGRFAGRRETLRDAKILMLPLNGAEVKTVASLPFEEVGDVSMTRDERRFVATVYS